MVVKQNVLANSMTALQHALVAELQSVMQQNRPLDMQHLTIVFFQSIAQTYRTLHEAMLREPPNQRPFQIANVSAILQAAEAYRALVIQQQQQEEAQRQASRQAQTAAPAPVPTSIPAAAMPVQNGQPKAPAVQAKPETPAVKAEGSTAPAQIVPQIPVTAVDFTKAIAAGDAVIKTNGSAEPSRVRPEDFAEAAPPADAPKIS